MRTLLVLALLLPFAAQADELPAFATGTWATGTWAAGIWGASTQVTVPDVVGETLTDADTALEAVELDTGTVTTRCSAEEADIVIRQTPKAGSFVELGSLIDLVASSGEECPPSDKPVNSISIDIGIRL